MTMRLMAVLLALVGVACGSGTNANTSTAVDCQVASVTHTDDCVRMNQVQVLGTHNSYHLAPAPALLAALGERGRNLDYTHRPLNEQLAMGIRQFELDVFADPEGGHYSAPAGLRLVPGLETPPANMRMPGFKVLHVQDIDFRSTCPTFVACLTLVRDWSQAHPGHVPILILVEAKDSVPSGPDGIRFVQPVAIDAAQLLALDAEIRSVFDSAHVVTPDDVRGSHATLNQAIRSQGWPRLREARGKVLFALDNTGAHRERYLEGASSLEGRMMFVSSPPGDPSSAFLKMNEAVGGEAMRIREMVASGYLVRTRADVPTDEARSGDTTRRDHALRSGAQYVSTDYPEASPFGSGYVARLPGAAGLAARCNPVATTPACRDEWLEPSAAR
jgi:hypothetical protein